MLVDSGGPGSAYLAIAAAADLNLLDTLTLKGVFGFSVGTAKVNVVADIKTAIEVDGSTLLALKGNANFTIDGDGFYGSLVLGLDATTDGTPIPAELGGTLIPTTATLCRNIPSYMAATLSYIHASSESDSTACDCKLALRIICALLNV